MKAIDLSKVETPTDYKKVAPGGYVCNIVSAKDYADKQYLKCEYDVAEGEFKGYYASLNSSKGFWGGNFIKSYADNALPYFKSFVQSLESTNKGYVWEWKESTLVGKGLGLVLAEEEYKANSGETKTRLYVAAIKTAEQIRKGDFTLPTLKKLEDKPGSICFSAASLKPVEDENLPF